MGNYDVVGGGGTSNWTPICFQDSKVYTAMSYLGPDTGIANKGEANADWVGSDGGLYSGQTPMLNDILAIQSIYGVETTTRVEHTVYGFNSTIKDSTQAVYDFSINKNPILCIFDSAGNDTLDLSGWNTKSEVDLASGHFSSCNDMTFNLSIAYSAIVENAVTGGGNDLLVANVLGSRLDGGAGNDMLIGSDGSDTFVAGLGNDLINGGDGIDTAIFSGVWSSYSFQVTDGNTITFSGAATGTDVLTGVEVFQFANATKTFGELRGGPVSQSIVSISALADSVLEGNSGNQTVSFLVSLDKAAATPQDLHWSALRDGVFGVDASTASRSDLVGMLSGSLAFNAGETQKTIEVQVAGDLLLEGDERLQVTLFNQSSGLVLGKSHATTIILNDDQTTAASSVVGTSNSPMTGGSDIAVGGTGSDYLASALLGTSTIPSGLELLVF